MKKTLWILFVSLFVLQLSAQTAVQGTVKDSGTGEPIIGVKVTLLQQNISTQTNANGEFFFSYIDAGSEELSFSRIGYFAQIKMLDIKAGQDNDAGTINLRPDVQAETKQDVILQLSEAQLNDEGIAQNTFGSFSSQTDVYISQTGFSFSPMRFRTRGYDNKYESYYINGVRFVDAERGGFNYSSIGGLNNATRDRDLVFGLTPNAFSFGNLGANTNINTRASAIAAGSNAAVAMSNRSYKVRAQYTYGTGVMNNGWAFAVSGVIRWSDDNKDLLKLVEGTFYNSAGLFLSAEKFFNDQHSLSLMAMGAPTRRAGQAPITQEARELTGSIYYNPYWGYQDGKVRSSRVVNAFDPTAVLSHNWKISDKQRLRTGLGFHYSMYSGSSLSYNGSSHAPDYYRNMPSFLLTKEGSNANAISELKELWQTDKNTQQIDWNELYTRNYENNRENPNGWDSSASIEENRNNTKGQARYALLRRHNNLMETSLNSTYTHQFNNDLKLTAGIEARTSKGMHYQTVDDLMGAKQYIDIDNFVERDLVGETLQDANPRMIENDLNDENKNKKEGDIVGYNYDINVNTANAFATLEYRHERFNMFAGIKGSYTSFYRYGYMDNGRVLYLHEQKGQKDVKSLGRSDSTQMFIDPSAKAGFIYSIDNKNQVSANILVETRAPLVQDAYVSERIKDVLAPNLKSEKILSYDLNYTFNNSFARGRISGFRTHIHDAIDKIMYYDDDYRTTVNHLLSGADKIYQGVEVGVSIPINAMFTLSTAGTFADYRYTNNAIGTKSLENGSEDDSEEMVMTKGLKINAGPQFAANATLSFFYKMWFVDVTMNYYANNYLDFSPNRFSKSNYGNLPAEFYEEKNMKMLNDKFTEQDGGSVKTVNTSKLQDWFTNNEYKSYWGLAKDETMDFGKFGGVIQKNADGNTVIEPSEVRQKLAMQEKLNSGFMLDLSVGKVIYLKNRKSLNFNASISNVLNNTNLVSGGFQQARIPTNSNKTLNEKGLDWFPNKYYYAMGLNFFLHVGYKF